MSLKYCEICDSYQEYSEQEDVLACGHHPDADHHYFDDYEFEGEGYSNVDEDVVDYDED